MLKSKYKDFIWKCIAFSLLSCYKKKKMRFVFHVSEYLQDLSEVLLYLLLPKDDFQSKPFRYIIRVRKCFHLVFVDCNADWVYLLEQFCYLCFTVYDFWIIYSVLINCINWSTKHSSFCTSYSYYSKSFRSCKLEKL